MNKKDKITIILAILFVTFLFFIGVTYSYLTYEKEIEYSFTIDKMNANITITGTNNETVSCSNSDLAYIDFKNDFILDKNNLLGKMASEIKISLTIDNNFSSRVNIKITSFADIPGLVYLIIPENAESINESFILKNNDDILQISYGEESDNNNWHNVIDLKNITDINSNESFRNYLNTYNQNLLKSLYEDNKYTGDTTLAYRILLWGDYYSLSDNDKLIYDTLSFNFMINAKVMQAKDDYGGLVNYEND